MPPASSLHPRSSSACRLGPRQARGSGDPAPARPIEREAGARPGTSRFEDAPPALPRAGAAVGCWSGVNHAAPIDFREVGEPAEMEPPAPRFTLPTDHLKGISGAYVFASEEMMGWAVYGVLDGSAEAVWLGTAEAGPRGKDTTLFIEEINVAPEAQGRGVATALYQFLIDHYSRPGSVIDRLEGTSKTGTNREVILQALIDALRTAPGFRPPDSSQEIQRRFVESCGHIVKDHPDAVTAALLQAPSARIAQKLGFTLDRSSVVFDHEALADGPQVVIAFAMSR
jgi:GNAT superfamily N-acetyltransferase